VSISSTFYVRIFRTNVILAAFFLITCTWKKLPKQRLYEKRTGIKLMKLTARLAHVAGLEAHIGAVKKKKIFTVASHLVMCIWDLLTAVDAPLFILFD